MTKNDVSGMSPTRVRAEINGYGTTIDRPQDSSPDTTTDEYADIQLDVNIRKTQEYILPLARRLKAQTVVDIGCGVGAMVKTLLEQGFDAYGTDLQGLERFWSRQNLPRDRFFVVSAQDMRLPFHDNSVDLAFTLGVIEHVGTSDGHADRLPAYHQIRRAWLLETLRVIKVGGSLLIGGPNRNFPVDVAHGLDSRASSFEQFLSRKVGASVHKTWGENFLWGYGDLRRYLAGLPCEITAQSVAGYLGFSRVPAKLRSVVEAYVGRMPGFLLGTGFNPWMMALVSKISAFPE
jgi:SAM-dependent methyltransferase